MIKNKQILIEIDFDKFTQFESLLETNDFGFEINDFCYPVIMCDASLYKERILNYKRLIQKYSGRNITMHGAFFSLVLHSKDPDIAKLSRNKIIQSIQTATELNCSKVIFHTGIIPQAVGSILNEIVDIHYNFWGELIEEYKNIEICIENVWEKNADFFESLLLKVNNSRFTMCIDNGHANVFSDDPISAWVNRLQKYVSHVHLSDNDSRTDQHLGLGIGSLNISNEIKDFLKIDKNLTYKLEVHSYEGIKESIDYLVKNEIVRW